MVKRVLLILTCLLPACPGLSHAWRDYYWDYHGSGRDYAYSQYVDMYYSPDYVSPLFIDDTPYFARVTTPLITPLSPQFQVPVLPAAPPEFTVNIPNDRGGYTAVVIKRSGNGYTGPQGEYYPDFPKVSQLKLMYGR